ncbi:hypothetical protein QQP08_004490 [Theobroma cacao]|nr:hypothetical protein QQP08_004490 [Theobroma cacao]
MTRTNREMVLNSLIMPKFLLSLDMKGHG